MTRILTWRVGLRGWGLALLGVVWVLIGVGVAVGASNPPDNQALWHVIIPRWMRAAMWIVTGLVALVGARWRRCSDIALGVLTIMPTVRLTSYIAAWVTYLIPGVPEGSKWGWYSGAFYIVMLGFVVLVACIPSPSGRRARERELLARIGGDGGGHD